MVGPRDIQSREGPVPQWRLHGMIYVPERRPCVKRSLIGQYLDRGGRIGEGEGYVYRHLNSYEAVIELMSRENQGINELTHISLFSKRLFSSCTTAPVSEEQSQRQVHEPTGIIPRSA